MTHASLVALTPVPTLRPMIAEWLAENDATLPPPGDKAKHIRDPLHGAIVLSPGEVRLLDTFPMQRLRGIRQLGLAYLTFPGAGHSRLEHALGVRFVARRMLDRLEDVLGRPYSPTVRATILAAALLHDVGHGIFSHATESIIATYPTLRAQYETQSENALHEQIGAVLIETDPIAACLTAMGVDPAAVSALMRHDTAQLTQLEIPAELWGIISGPLDADKLDYFARDSYFSGVVSSVDPERILQTLTVSPTQQLAVTLAGASALDKMLYDRVHMYGDLYGHQKILAAEAMVRAIVETMFLPRRHSLIYVRGPQGRSVGIRMQRLTDYLRMSDEAFLAAPTNNEQVAAIQHRLVHRDLLHRAYTLSYESVRGASEETYLRALQRLRRSETLARLRRDVIAHHPEIDATDIWFAATRSPAMDGVGASIVGLGNRPVPTGTAFSDWDHRDPDGIPQHTVLRHFELYRAKIYCFCPPDVAQAVGATARAALQALWDEPTGELV